MTDEFDVFHANHEESQQIVDWAIATGSAIWMMREMLRQQEYGSMEEMQQDIDETLELILNNVPMVMVDPIKAITFSAIEEQVAEDAALEEFREELKDL